MRTKLMALMIALFLLAPTVASADVVFVLKNTSDQTRVVVLYWMDHPHGTEKPFAIAGATLEPGKSFEMDEPYPPGVYYAEWSFPTVGHPDKGHVVHVGKRSRTLQITPNGVELLNTNPVKKGISI